MLNPIASSKSALVLKPVTTPSKVHVAPLENVITHSCSSPPTKSTKLASAVPKSLKYPSADTSPPSLNPPINSLYPPVLSNVVTSIVSADSSTPLIDVSPPTIVEPIGCT